MLLAYDYPLLSVFFSIMWFFLLVVWIMTVFQVIIDIFRSSDMGGFSKAIWLFVVIIAPIFGVLIYLIARGDKMAKRTVQDAQDRDAAFQNYVRTTAGTSGPADQLTQLASLRDSGAITEDDFQAGKAKILG